MPSKPAGHRDSTGAPSGYFQSCSKGAACRPLSTANSQYSPGADLRKAVSAFLVAVVWTLLHWCSFFKSRRAMHSEFGREPLRQPALGGFVAPAPGFQ